MELKQIRCFEEAYRYQSFSKAADMLFISQQGVSKQIAALEKELGTPLFVRRSRGVEVTEAGRFFHGEAQAVLAAEERIRTHFAGADGKSYALKVGVSHGLESFFDDAFFSAFAARDPQIRLQTSTFWNPLVDESVRSGSLDAGFSLAPLRLPGLHAESILKIPLWCLVNVQNPLANRAYVSLDEILNGPLAIADENYNSFYAFLELCVRRGKDPKIVKTFDLLSIYNFVERHPETVGFTLENYRTSVSFPKVKALPVSDPEAILDICLVWREDGKSKAVKMLAEYSKEVL